jgi:hypothetical protein
VVAEHGHGAWPKRLHEAQARERIGAAIDEVADEPQAILGGIETRRIEQALEGLEAALQVADREDRQVYFTVATR